MQMLQKLKEHVVLRVQAKTGFTLLFFVSVAIAGVALVMTFVFLCVTADAWLSVKLGPVFGALIMAGIFVVIAIIGFVAAAISRQRTKQRAILEQAARLQQPVALLDPAMLSVVRQAAQTLEWRRIAPIALLGFLAAQWAQETLAPRRPK